MAKSKILVVDDEHHIVELVKFNLDKEGYQVETAFDGRNALIAVENRRPDLIILDVMLPELDGFEVCRTLQKNPDTCDIPIIMLTARVEEIDKVLGLELGADDYITKPFSPRELVARVKARLRRTAKNAETKKDAGEVIKINGLVIDPDKYAVYLEDVKLDLTPKEFELLRMLAQNRGRVLTRDYLLEKIWGYDYAGDTRTVDVHIRHIRQKIESQPGDFQCIETIRGVGYKFKE
ncbi:MAG: response regulator [Bacillota bacterium]